MQLLSPTVRVFNWYGLYPQSVAFAGSQLKQTMHREAETVLSLR